MVAVILTGGKSRRMGSDKALLEIDDMTALERTIRLYGQHFQRVAVSVDRPGRFPTYGAEEVVDRYPGKGILAGLHAAFHSLDTDSVFLTAVDMPYADPTLALELERRIGPGYDACLIVQNGRPEAGFAVYRRSCLPYLEDCLKRDRLPAKALLAALRVRELEPEELPGWDLDRILFNMNRPQDYRQVRRGGVDKKHVPVVSFVGWSGSGKTTFLEKLIPALKARNIRLAVIKHDAHKFEIDRPGKDTYRFAAAGADTVVISSDEKLALIQKRTDAPALEEILGYIRGVDLIVTEGYKTGSAEKVEIHRRATGKPLACGGDPNLIGVVTDEPVAAEAPQFGLDDIEAVAELLTAKLD